MVDALQEARRVLAPGGVLIDVRPVVAPIVVELTASDGAEAIGTQEVAAYSAPDDVAAADAAMRHAISAGWFAFEKSSSFDFEILCDTAAELRDYVQTRKLRGAEIPYDELEERRLTELSKRAGGQAPRLRCRRPWMLSTYHKR